MMQKYSLWLTPSDAELATLQQLVDELAQETKAPHFVPHATLVANIMTSDQELDELVRQTSTLANAISTVQAKVGKYDYTPEEFRCLFLPLSSPLFDAAYDQASRVFPQVHDEHFRGLPHMSVLYGIFTPEKKQQLIAAHPNQLSTLSLDTLGLYRTNNPVEAWELVRAFPLQSIS